MDYLLTPNIYQVYIYNLHGQQSNRWRKKNHNISSFPVGPVRYDSILNYAQILKLGVVRLPDYVFISKYVIKLGSGPKFGLMN